jgi:methionine aminopeptidase
MVRIRTEREIQLISESCQIVADTLEILSSKMIAGTSILELDRIAEEYILSQNARPAFKGYRGFPSTLCVSVEDEVVHGIPLYPLNAGLAFWLRIYSSAIRSSSRIDVPAIIFEDKISRVSATI